MKRRKFLYNIAATAGGMVLFKDLFAQRMGPSAPDPAAVKLAVAQASGAPSKIDKLEISSAEWRKRLTAAQFDVLREEGTERPGSSALNNEKRKGVYHCAGCDLPLFTSEMKYESGSGWPSFFTTLPGAMAKKTDFKLIYPRTEYHCARCGGHQGHIFKDGPAPTKERWCNNGVALNFKASA